MEFLFNTKIFKNKKPAVRPAFLLGGYKKIYTDISINALLTSSFCNFTFV
jgi:hypothetical protein